MERFLVSFFFEHLKLNYKFVFSLTCSYVISWEMCLFGNIKTSRYWRQEILHVFEWTTYSRTPRAGGGARLSWLMTTIMGENGGIHFGGTCTKEYYSLVIPLNTDSMLKIVCRKKWQGECRDSLKMRCLSREPVWGRLDTMLILSPLSQRSLRLRSGLLPWRQIENTGSNIAGCLHCFK